MNKFVLTVLNLLLYIKACCIFVLCLFTPDNYWFNDFAKKYTKYFAGDVNISYRLFKIQMEFDMKYNVCRSWVQVFCMIWRLPEPVLKRMGGNLIDF